MLAQTRFRASADVTSKNDVDALYEYALVEVRTD